MSIQLIKQETQKAHYARAPISSRFYKLLRLMLYLLLIGSTYGQNDADLFAAAKSGSETDVQALIDTGANVHARDIYNQTPLMYAAGSNDAGVIQTLINAGADVNALADGNWRALMYAVRDNPDPGAFLALLPFSEDPARFPTELYMDSDFGYGVTLPTWMPTSTFEVRDGKGVTLDMPNQLGKFTVWGEPNDTEQTLEEVRGKVLSENDMTVIGSHDSWFAVTGRSSNAVGKILRQATFVTDSVIVTFTAEFEPEASAFFEAFSRFNGNFIRLAGSHHTSSTAPSYAAADFPSGSRITIITDSLNVRSEPNINAAPVGAQLRGATATLVSPDPIWNSEYWWWHLEFTDGTRGWSAQGTESETYLAIATNKTSNTGGSSNAGASTQPEREPAISVLRGPGFVLEEIRAFWTSEADVLGAQVLILPEIRYRVRVEGPNPISSLQIKAVFYIESDGALDHLSENTQYVVSSSDIPLQPNTRKQGWITSSRGYVDSGLTALRFLQGNAPNTYVDLYYRLRYSDNWQFLDRITASKEFQR